MLIFGLILITRVIWVVKKQFFIVSNKNLSTTLSSLGKYLQETCFFSKLDAVTLKILRDKNKLWGPLLAVGYILVLQVTRSRPR